jgi:hypothetical protein
MRDERRLRFRIEKIGGRSKESKFLRMVSMQPRFEQGRIFFCEPDVNQTIGIDPQYLRMGKNGKPTGEIVQEFVRIPRGTHDDIPDALSDIDKIKNETKTYYFNGPPAYGSVSHHHRGPSVMNGKVVATYLDPNQPREEPRQGAVDKYKRLADRVRGQYGR